MRVAIIDLKWSYGIECISAEIRSRLLRHCEVELISASESRLEHSLPIAKSRTSKDMILAFINPLVYWRVLKNLRAIDPRVIYFISPHILNVPLVWMSEWFTDALVISHIHDPDYAKSSMVAQVANMVARMQSRWSDRVYCWGHAIKATIARKFHVRPDRIAVFRHGPGHVTPADEQSGARSSRTPKQFSMIGTVHPRKGIAYYLEAARLFNERHGTDAAQFLLAGSGDLSRYKAAIERLPNLVVVNRFLEDAEVNEFLADSYASVLPYIEGVMQTSFIAIAYGNGCPVIVSNIGSLPEEVEDGKTGYVVEKASAEQIAAAMTGIYTDPDRARMKENCVAAYREKFNWNVIGDQIYRDMEASVAQLSKRGRARHELREESGS